MPRRIDPTRREITVGSRRLPFRLDLRNDRVSVTLGGEETAVRPLQWREKVTLARFADLGPEFLRDEVIRLCTLTELPETLEEEDAAVLWELAAWMSESPAATPVPLDSRSLASVTLRLCRAMGLRPADFDTRSAPEVEAMWGALGEDVVAPSQEESSSSATTRIVIVPDEMPPQPSPSVAPATQVPDVGRASARPVGLKPDLRSAQATSVATASQSIGAMAMSRAQQRGEQAIPPGGRQAILPVEERGRQAILPVEGTVEGIVEGIIEGTIEGTDRIVCPPPAERIAEPRGVDLMSFEPSRVSTALAIEPRHLLRAQAAPAIEPRRVTKNFAPAIDRRAAVEQLAVVEMPLLALERPEARSERALEAAPQPPPPDFFEEFADRLEQAAAEMGLGEE